MEAFSNFHFLRPAWLFALLLLPLIWLLLRKTHQGINDWKTAIDPRLLEHLMPKVSTQSSSSSSLLIYAIFITSILSLSGPTWQRINQPVSSVSDNMVVILDLSISMLATDQKPNRLTRAKQKLIDLLELRKEGNTALIVYSGDSHVVTPLTDDVNTIKANVSALDPFIMPVIGSRPDLAIIQAKSLFNDTGTNQGRIVLITDDINKEQIETIDDVLTNTNISLNVIAVGTPEGGPIDIPGRGYFKSEGVTVIPKTDINLLSELTKTSNGTIVPISINDSDLNQLDISGSLLDKKVQKSDNHNFDSWEDNGYLLLIIIIPLALISYKRNLLLSISVVMLTQLYSEPSYAFSWEDLWLTKDQQAQKLAAQGKHTEAKELFDSAEHQAFSGYQSGDFEKASKQYESMLQNNEHNAKSKDLFNYATSLAKQTKLQEALDIYNELLQEQPDHKDALHNKSIVEQLLNNAQQNQDQSQKQDQNNNQDQNNKQDSSNEQSSEQDSNDQQSSDQSSEQNPSEQKKNSESNDEDSQNSENDQNETQDQSNSSKNNKDNTKQANSDELNDQDELSNKELLNEDFKKLDQQNLEQPQKSQRLDAVQDTLSEEERQSYEQWMRRVPDDPSGLLRRKFEQQALERQRQGKSNYDKSEGPIW